MYGFICLREFATCMRNSCWHASFNYAAFSPEISDERQWKCWRYFGTFLCGGRMNRRWKWRSLLTWTWTWMLPDVGSPQAIPDCVKDVTWRKNNPITQSIILFKKLNNHHQWTTVAMLLPYSLFALIKARWTSLPTHSTIRDSKWSGMKAVIRGRPVDLIHLYDDTRADYSAVGNNSACKWAKWLLHLKKMTSQII